MHAPLATSPTIDADNTRNFATGRRGTGFTREVNGTADIGAYEHQVNDDEVFYGRFDRRKERRQSAFHFENKALCRCFAKRIIPSPFKDVFRDRF